MYSVHHREFQYRCCISSTQKWSTQNAATVPKCICEFRHYRVGPNWRRPATPVLGTACAHHLSQHDMSSRSRACGRPPVHARARGACMRCASASRDATDQRCKRYVYVSRCCRTSCCTYAPVMTARSCSEGQVCLHRSSLLISSTHVASQLSTSTQAGRCVHVLYEKQ